MVHIKNQKRRISYKAHTHRTNVAIIIRYDVYIIIAVFHCENSEVDATFRRYTENIFDATSRRCRENAAYLQLHDTRYNFKYLTIKYTCKLRDHSTVYPQQWSPFVPGTTFDKMSDCVEKPRTQTCAKKKYGRSLLQINYRALLAEFAIWFFKTYSKPTRTRPVKYALI